jgi:hypothetical protein
MIRILVFGLGVRFIVVWRRQPIENAGCVVVLDVVQVGVTRGRDLAP